MNPRVEFRLAFAPTRRVFPDSHEHFLRDVFRFHAVAQHAHGQREQTRQLACDERAHGGRIVAADLLEQLRVGVAFTQDAALPAYMRCNSRRLQLSCSLRVQR